MFHDKLVRLIAQDAYKSHHDALEKLMHPANPREAPPWRDDPFHNMFLKVAEDLLTKYDIKPKEKSHE